MGMLFSLLGGARGGGERREGRGENMDRGGGSWPNCVIPPILYRPVGL